MIISYIMGGLGNQLFQYATGRRLAHKLNTELKLDLTYYISDNLRPYVLNLFNIKESVATPEEIAYIKQLSLQREFGKENENATFMPEVLNYPDNIYLYGYWQHEEYFADISEILRHELKLKNPLSTSAQHWKEKILASESVSLHFRHGDFGYSPILGLFSSNAVLPLDYYYQCIEILKREYKNLTLFVFSNNLQWCKENFHADVPIEFVEGENLKDFEELHLMSLCKHNIIANSTFSWWGAWLNQNPDKKVFMPIPASEQARINYRYSPIRNENSPLDSDRWIRIPFDVNSKPDVTMRPWFSILLVVNNDVATLVETINTILGQDYKFFELIIIDNASTDGSSKICRQVAQTYDNVTLIKLHSGVQNVAAWNIALNAAQGHYVLFLKGNDRILANALTSLYLTNEHIVADVVNIVSYLRISVHKRLSKV